MTTLIKLNEYEISDGILTIHLSLKEWEFKFDISLEDVRTIRENAAYDFDRIMAFMVENYEEDELFTNFIFNMHELGKIENLSDLIRSAIFADQEFGHNSNLSFEKIEAFRRSKSKILSMWEFGLKAYYDNFYKEIKKIRNGRYLNFMQSYNRCNMKMLMVILHDQILNIKLQDKFQVEVTDDKEFDEPQVIESQKQSQVMGDQQVNVEEDFLDILISKVTIDEKVPENIKEAEEPKDVVEKPEVTVEESNKFNFVDPKIKKKWIIYPETYAPGDFNYLINSRIHEDTDFYDFNPAYQDAYLELDKRIRENSHRGDLLYKYHGIYNHRSKDTNWCIPWNKGANSVLTKNFMKYMATVKSVPDIFPMVKPYKDYNEDSGSRHWIFLRYDNSTQY